MLTSSHATHHGLIVHMISTNNRHFRRKRLWYQATILNHWFENTDQSRGAWSKLVIYFANGVFWIWFCDIKVSLVSWFLKHVPSCFNPWCSNEIYNWYLVPRGWIATMHCTSVRFRKFFVTPRAGLNVIDVFEALYQYPIEKVFMKPREGLSVIDLFENCS